MPGRSRFLARDFRATVAAASLTPQLDRDHGGDVGRWASSAGIPASDLVDFSASINPLGPPAGARAAFTRSYGDIARYPPPYADRLKIALARRHGMHPAEVLVGNGSTQLIYLLCAALRPRLALIVGPAFSEYANALSLAGARVRYLAFAADENFQFSPVRFMAAWEQDCDIAFLANPNSVTGQLVPKTTVEKIAQAALISRRLTVIDEAFIDFIESESVTALVRENPYLLVLRSLTKYYALPGLRLGYLLGQARRIAQLVKHQEPWSVNTAAANVALACLGDRQFALKTEQWLMKERAFLSKQLMKLRGFQPVPSCANFLLVKIAGGGDALTLRSFLLSRRILIRPCDSFRGLGRDYFRVAIRRRADNLRLVGALRDWRAAAS